MDKQVWLPDSSGSYTTKSGYKQIFENKTVLSQDQFNWIKSIWKLHTSLKIYHFLWRALNNALPVGSLLATRGINAELMCKQCGELETISHLLLDCNFEVEVWAKAPLVTLDNRVSATEPFRDQLSSHVSTGTLSPIGLTSSPIVPWPLWNLSTARNKLIFGDKIFQVEDIISKLVKEDGEWENANARKPKQKERKAPDSKILPSAPAC